MMISLRLLLLRTAILIQKKKTKSKKRRFWVREILKERDEKGAFKQLVGDLRLFDREYFFRFIRMSPERLDDLLSQVGPLLAKKPCHSREPISPAQRLIVTLRYLASGDSQQTHAFYFRLGRSTVCKIIKETTQAIWTSLQPRYLQYPETYSQWEVLAAEFEREWNFPNCIGALDGKHVQIEAPANSGSAYYNYKNFHSMVLMAICDAKYCFTMVDIGSYGRDNDASIFSESAMRHGFENRIFKLPENREIGPFSIPPVLVGDDIFPLKTYLLKPYPGKDLSLEKRIFNYRLSRARRTIENVFGILVAKFRIFRGSIKGKPMHVENIIKATVCLHNYLRLTEGPRYLPTGFVDCESNSGEIIPGDWRKELNDTSFINLPKSRSNRSNQESNEIRDDLCNYFNSNQGSLSWQLDYVTSCGHNPVNKRVFVNT